jgi:hypothetical protein
MRASSPPIAIYKTPLKGMDSREVRPQDAPNLLFNIDLSNRGYYQARPGVKTILDFSSRGSISSPVFLGLHTTRVEGNLFIISLFSDDSDSRVKLSILNSFGEEVFPGYPVTLREEPLNKRFRYSFVNAGRFVYFCNGYGKFWELEIKDVLPASVSEVTLEVGARPAVYSYITDKISPSSLQYFYQQLVVSGFKKSKTINLSSVAGVVDSEKPWPPSEVLSTERTEVSLDEGCIFVAEPGLWRSYPIQDPGGFYWVYDDDVVATAGIGTNLIVFCQKSVRVVIGHGTKNPRVTTLSDVSIVGPHAISYYGGFVFFVAMDGCYITNGQTLQKVSYEMDPLWFGRDVPQITRYTQQQIQKTAYPFHVNRNAVYNTVCVNDQTRQQIMVCLPANDSPTNNMVWVYNYADLQERVGTGKWSIWAGSEEPTYAGDDLTPGASFPASDATNPTVQNTPSRLFHWNCVSSDKHNGVQRVFAGTNDGRLLEFGTTTQDYSVYPQYNAAGTRTTVPSITHFPLAIGLGRVGRVDSDGRIICTDIAVRRKQLSKNVEDSSTATKLLAVVRSEGEGLKHFDAQETDVEFSDTILNSQQGVSENTTSVLNSLKLGEKPTGTSSPLMQSEYIEAYARVNVPDEDGRAAYVDLYSLPTSEPHRLQVSEIRVHANVKGGSQREQS